MRKDHANIFYHLESCHVASKSSLFQVFSVINYCKHHENGLCLIQLCCSKTAEENEVYIIKISVSPNSRTLDRLVWSLGHFFTHPAAGVNTLWFPSKFTHASEVYLPIGNLASGFSLPSNPIFPNPLPLPNQNYHPPSPLRLRETMVYFCSFCQYK